GAGEVVVQRVGLVLGEHLHLQHTRVGKVGETEIDDPVPPSEGHRRFRPLPGEGLQAGAGAPREGHRQPLAPGAPHLDTTGRSVDELESPALMGVHPQALAGTELSRRSLLKRGLLGGSLLALGGMGFLALRGGRAVPLPPEGLRVFSPREYAVLDAVARRLVRPRKGWPTVDELGVALAADRI